MPPAGMSMPDSAKDKLRLYKLGRKDSTNTRRRKSVARKAQVPPNTKHGKYSKQAKKEQLENTCIKRLSGLIELKDEQIQPYLDTMHSYQTDVYYLNIFLKNIFKIKKKNREIWLEYSLLKKQEETGSYPLNWYKCASEDIGLKLNFSLSEVKDRQDQIVKEHTQALKGDDLLKKSKYIRKIRHLEKLFCDVARVMNDGEEIHLLYPYGSPITNKNYKPLLKLMVVLDMLGLKKDIDKRQYLKGVFSQKNKMNGCKFIPVKTIASPLCILDFLFYLKQYWYEIHGYSTGQNKEKNRELEYGRDYYEERAGTTCGFVADMVHTCRTSRLRSEITQLNDMEECVWYFWQSSALKPFKKLIRRARPDIYRQVLKIRKEVKEDDRLKEILHRIKLDGEERWRRSEFPMFGDVETDRGALEYAFRGKPKIYREALKIYEDLRWQQQQKNST